MEVNRKQLLSGVCGEVFEELAFMFGEEADAAELPPPSPSGVLAAMSFSGPLSGRIELAVPAAMRAEIAANVLGIDTEDPEAEAVGDDSLKEVLNVTCGQVLTRLAGEEPVFDLAVPEVSPLSVEGWKKLAAAPETAGMLVDESPTLLRLVMDGASD